MLATGGIGRAYKITSNSWEYTGDGHALAYDAGAELMDMEFVQFHPTGMVWPPSVRGILVTEGVRGEGGVLKNSEGRRFMFDDIPENYSAQTADNEEEGWRYTQGDKTARRPPELLTRDHVAAASCARSRRAAAARTAACSSTSRGSRSGCRTRAEHIKKKLPSMYHQFKQLADIDITKEPMEVGPTTHYIMGGVRVDADTQMSTVPGPVRRRRVRGRHQRRESARRQLALRPPRVRQARRRVRREVREGSSRAAPIDARQVDEAARRALEPFERGTAGRGAVPGAVRPAGDDAGPRRHRAQRGGDAARARRARAAARAGRAASASAGNREYNPGWHTALDLHNLLTVSEAITRSAIERKESRGGHFRDDYPGQGRRPSASSTSSSARAATAGWKSSRAPIPEMPEELKHVIEEMK